MVAQTIFPNEGEAVFAAMLFKNDSTVRPANLELMLFNTSITVDETTTYAQLVVAEISGGSYARKTLVDANWTLTNGVMSYPVQTFTPVTTGYTGNIQGAAIVTKGSSPKILFINTDTLQPITLTAGTPYNVTPNIACSSVVKGNIEFLLRLLLKNETSLRGTGMKAVLFTDATNVTALLASQLTQPTSVGGYAAVDILDSDWTISTATGDAVATCPQLTFTPTGSTFSAPIAGYAIVTNGNGYVVAIELDPTQPVTIPLNTPYQVTPSIKIM